MQYPHYHAIRRSVFMLFCFVHARDRTSDRKLISTADQFADFLDLLYLLSGDWISGANSSVISSWSIFELCPMTSDEGARFEDDTPWVLLCSFKFMCEADLVRLFDDRRYFASSDDWSICWRGCASTVDPSVSVDGGGISFRRTASVYRSIFRSDFPSILRRLFASSSTAWSDFPKDCRTSLISSLLIATLLDSIAFSSLSVWSSLLRTAI